MIKDFGTLVYRIDVHARLLILREKSPLHGLILVCTFIDFEKKFPPARLLCPTRLMFFKNFSSCTFIPSCTSIRYTRVLTVLCHSRFKTGMWEAPGQKSMKLESYLLGQFNIKCSNLIHFFSNIYHVNCYFVLF